MNELKQVPMQLRHKAKMIVEETKPGHFVIRKDADMFNHSVGMSVRKPELYLRTQDKVIIIYADGSGKTNIEL